MLIGTIYSLARLAQSSEFTILRTGGLGPARALRLLALLALLFSAVTFALGDYVAPVSERQSALLKATQAGGRKLGRTGAWLKDRAGHRAGRAQLLGQRRRHRRPGHAGGHPHLRVRRRRPHLSRITAREARVGADAVWTLSDAEVTSWPTGTSDPASATVQVQRQALPTLKWPSTLSAGVVSAAVLPLKTMSTVELWRYSQHLSDQEQAAQRYEIQFWKKALYPLACLVMIALALPFAYLHARAGGISLKVFGGIMLGISFVLLNNVAGHIGLLRDWTPWIVAATPSALFLLLSLAAFGWLVRYR